MEGCLYLCNGGRVNWLSLAYARYSGSIRASCVLQGGRVQVGVRVYAWRESLESIEVARPPAAPQYWIKTRSVEAVALVRLHGCAQRGTASVITRLYAAKAFRTPMNAS